jgi:phosphodiesterase/alkaline phosphatase D-like protein
MDVLLGPVLTFRGNELDLWKVSALVALDRKGKGKPPKLAWSLKKQVGAGAALADAAVIHSFTSASKAQAQVVRFDLEVAQTDSQQQIFYRVGAGNTYSFVVPARQTSPRMAYASCNGFSDLKAMKKIGDQNALWKDVLQKHRAAPYNLLLMGGDQIYSDSMWTRVPELEAWSALPGRNA